MIRWIILGIIVIVIAGAVYAASMTAQPVDAADAREGSISAWIEERAKTRLPKTHRITMPIDGRILPITLVEGDRVESNETVARIESADLETAVAMAQARVDRLEARIVENNDTRLELSLIEGLQNEIDSIQRAVEAAAAKTEASKAREAYRETDLKRKAEALAEDAATRKEYEEAELAAIESRVNYRTDVLTLSALEAILRAAQIGPRAVRQYIEKKALSEAVLERELAEARADLEMAKRNRKRGEITTPVAGVVLSRAVSNRRVLSAGALLVEIGRLEELEVEAEILSQEAGAIELGDRVEIFGPAVGEDPIPGRVSRIEPRGFTKISSLGVEQQRVRVIIAFADEAPATLEERRSELGVEYRVQVRIHTDERTNTIVIPRSALFRGTGDRWQAFVIRGGRARLVDLTVGLMNDVEVEVLEGLEAGEPVILAPESQLEDGARVTPRDS